MPGLVIGGATGRRFFLRGLHNFGPLYQLLLVGPTTLNSVYKENYVAPFSASLSRSAVVATHLILSSPSQNSRAACFVRVRCLFCTRNRLSGRHYKLGE